MDRRQRPRHRARAIPPEFPRQEEDRRDQSDRAEQVVEQERQLPHPENRVGQGQGQQEPEPRFMNVRDPVLAVDPLGRDGRVDDVVADLDAREVAQADAGRHDQEEKQDDPRPR